MPQPTIVQALTAAATPHHMASLAEEAPPIKDRQRTWRTFSLASAVAVVTISILAVAYTNKPTTPTAQVTSPAVSHQVALQNLLPVAVNRGLPLRLDIPKLQIQANILYMGVAPSGGMAVPTNIVDVGWYKYGPLPGNNGSAVIAGHLDGLKGQAGVFSHLDQLKSGDSLTVTDDKGQNTSFTVRKTQLYSQNDQPTEVFNSHAGAHLNLITCTGGWDASQHRYLQRLVVFTDKTT